MTPFAQPPSVRRRLLWIAVGSCALASLPVWVASVL